MAALKTYTWNPREYSMDVLHGSRSLRLKCQPIGGAPGFECGCISPGARALAYAILEDCRGEADAVKYYRCFAFGVLSGKNPTERWTIDSDGISCWIASMREKLARWAAQARDYI